MLVLLNDHQKVKRNQFRTLEVYSLHSILPIGARSCSLIISDACCEIFAQAVIFASYLLDFVRGAEESPSAPRLGGRRVLRRRSMEMETCRHGVGAENSVALHLTIADRPKTCSSRTADDADRRADTRSLKNQRIVEIVMQILRS
jgi:hypothetical protein